MKIRDLPFFFIFFMLSFCAALAGTTKLTTWYPPPAASYNTVTFATSASPNCSTGLYNGTVYMNNSVGSLQACIVGTATNYPQECYNSFCSYDSSVYPSITSAGNPCASFAQSITPNSAGACPTGYVQIALDGANDTYETYEMSAHTQIVSIVCCDSPPACQNEICAGVCCQPTQTECYASTGACCTPSCQACRTSTVNDSCGNPNCGQNCPPSGYSSGPGVQCEISNSCCAYSCLYSCHSATPPASEDDNCSQQNTSLCPSNCGGTCESPNGITYSCCATTCAASCRTSVGNDNCNISNGSLCPSNCGGTCELGNTCCASTCTATCRTSTGTDNCGVSNSSLCPSNCGGTCELSNSCCATTCQEGATGRCSTTDGCGVANSSLCPITCGGGYSCSLSGHSGHCCIVSGYNVVCTS